MGKYRMRVGLQPRVRVPGAELGKGVKDKNPVEVIMDVLRRMLLKRRFERADQGCRCCLSSLEIVRALVASSVAWCEENRWPGESNEEVARRMIEERYPEGRVVIPCVLDRLPVQKGENIWEMLKREGENLSTVQALQALGLFTGNTLNALFDGAPSQSRDDGDKGKPEMGRWVIEEPGGGETGVYGLESKNLPEMVAGVFLRPSEGVVEVGVKFCLSNEAFVYAVRACLLQRLQEGKIPEP